MSKILIIVYNKDQSYHAQYQETIKRSFIKDFTIKDLTYDIIFIESDEDLIKYSNIIIDDIYDSVLLCIDGYFDSNNIDIIYNNIMCDLNKYKIFSNKDDIINVNALNVLKEYFYIYIKDSKENKICWKKDVFDIKESNKDIIEDEEDDEDYDEEYDEEYDEDVHVDDNNILLLL